MTDLMELKRRRRDRRERGMELAKQAASELETGNYDQAFDTLDQARNCAMWAAVYNDRINSHTETAEEATPTRENQT